jgi:5-methylcytosine-specific restriction endonuclease McrA
VTARSVPEWIGSSPDAEVPPRVRLRIFDAHHGVCHISGRKIMAGEPWELEHKIAIINGGEHRESNMAPALKDKHKAKTAEDVAEKSAIATKRKKHLGIAKSRHPMPGSKGSRFKRRMDGTVVPRET